jgi:hypothetical protein
MKATTNTNTKPVDGFKVLCAALTALGTADGKQVNNLQLAADALKSQYPTVKVFDALGADTLATLKRAYAKGRLSAADLKVYSALKAEMKGWTQDQKDARQKIQKDVNKAWDRIVAHAYPVAKAKPVAKVPVAKAKAAEGAEGANDTDAPALTGGKAPRLDTWAATLATMLKQAQSDDGIEGVNLHGFVAALRTAQSFLTLSDAAVEADAE